MLRIIHEPEWIGIHELSMKIYKVLCKHKDELLMNIHYTGRYKIQITRLRRYLMEEYNINVHPIVVGRAFHHLNHLGLIKIEYANTRRRGGRKTYVFTFVK